MKNWLLEAYPSPGNKSIRQVIRLSVGVGLFIGLFLIIFRPFGLPRSNDPWTILCILGYGLITCLSMIGFLYLLPKRFAKAFKDMEWNLWKAIIHQAILIFVIAFGNYFYSYLIFPNFPLDLQSFSYLTLGTFALGVIPSSFFISIDLLRSKFQYAKESDSLNALDEKVEESNEIPLNFQSDYDEPDVRCLLSEFLFAESDANYVSIFTRKEEQVERQIIRSSLKKIVEYISPFEGIMKTHRSYVVNLNEVERFTGNAQGFTLHFHNASPQAKVSRSFTKEVKKYFTNRP